MAVPNSPQQNAVNQGLAQLGAAANAFYGTPLYVTARLRDKSNRGGNPYAQLIRNAKSFEEKVNSIAAQAAARADRVSAAKAKALRPPAPPRPGRRSTPGALARNIQWSPKNGNVVLDRARLDKNVPWWVVQEIGTGNKATIKRGTTHATGNKGGRPTKASYNQPGGNHVSVKSQKGRRIPGSLAFASGPGGKYSAPSSRRDQQLFLLSSLKGVPRGLRQARYGTEMRIGREIQPKHFIRDGAREGFREYKQNLLAAAKTSLTKPRS